MIFLMYISSFDIRYVLNSNNHLFIRASADHYLLEKSVNVILPTICKQHPIHRWQNNPVGDAISRMDLSYIVATHIDVLELSTNQVFDPEFAETTTNPFFLFKCDSKIHCDVSTDKPRPFVLQTHRRDIFDRFNEISHPSIRLTTKMIADRFIGKKTFDKTSVNGRNTALFIKPEKPALCIFIVR